MTTPKSPEEIIASFDEYFPKPKFLSDSDQWIADVMSNAHQKSYHDFLRSSMASLLCYMAERMPEHASSSLPLPPYKDNLKYKEIDGKSCITEVDGAYNAAIDDCRCILIQMADGIWKE